MRKFRDPEQSSWSLQHLICIISSPGAIMLTSKVPISYKGAYKVNNTAEIEGNVLQARMSRLLTATVYIFSLCRLGHFAS